MKVEKVEEGEEDGGDFLYGDICFGAEAERVEEGDELYGDLYEEGGSLQMLKNSFHEVCFPSWLLSFSSPLSSVIILWFSFFLSCMG